MMNVVCLTPADRRLLQARFTEHGNSFRRMSDALTEVGAGDACARLRALRRVERRFGLDLAEICHRFARRNREGTHPMERMVVEFIAEERWQEGEPHLWVVPERVQQVRELMGGRLVGERES
jgi:hypothetical protein